MADHDYDAELKQLWQQAYPRTEGPLWGCDIAFHELLLAALRAAEDRGYQRGLWELLDERQRTRERLRSVLERIEEAQAIAAAELDERTDDHG